MATTDQKKILKIVSEAGIDDVCSIKTLLRESSFGTASLKPHLDTMVRMGLIGYTDSQHVCITEKGLSALAVRFKILLEEERDRYKGEPPEERFQRWIKEPEDQKGFAKLYYPLDEVEREDEGETPEEIYREWTKPQPSVKGLVIVKDIHKLDRQKEAKESQAKGIKMPQLSHMKRVRRGFRKGILIE